MPSGRLDGSLDRGFDGDLDRATRQSYSTGESLTEDPTAALTDALRAVKTAALDWNPRLIGDRRGDVQRQTAL